MIDNFSEKLNVGLCYYVVWNYTCLLSESTETFGSPISFGKSLLEWNEIILLFILMPEAGLILYILPGFTLGSVQSRMFSPKHMCFCPSLPTVV